MARRRKSSFQPGWLILVAALVLVAFLGTKVFHTKAADPDRSVAGFDASAYMENANSLRGNSYKIDGEVSNSLAWSPTEGRLFAVDVEQGKFTIPVLVTKEFNEVNIQKGQKFIFVVVVDEKGLLRTKKITKS